MGTYKKQHLNTIPKSCSNTHTHTHIIKAHKNTIFLSIKSNKFTTVHPWCDGYSTSISACGV